MYTLLTIINIKRVNMKYLIAISLMLFFTACANKKPVIFENGGVVAVIHSGDQKATYIKDHGDLARYCGARGTDGIEDSSKSFSFGLPTPVGNDNMGESSSAGAISLGGRDPIVLITREALYRACEMSMNLNLDKKESMQSYKMFLNFIQNIAKLDKNEGIKAIVQDTSSSIKVDTTNTNTDDTDDTDDTDED
jgi:hypothetical protein